MVPRLIHRTAVKLSCQCIAIPIYIVVIFTCVPCSGQQTIRQEAPDGLLAFAHLSYFSNRGFMMSPFAGTNGTGKEHSFDVGLRSIPEEIRDYLGQREDNLLTSQHRIGWLAEYPDDEREFDVTLKRFSQFGLVELFHHQNARLLDKPLESRKELMDQLNEIADRVAVIRAGLISNKDLGKDALIVFWGNLRRLSVECDLAIINALSREERLRVNKLVAVIMPISIEMITRNDNARGPFGFDVSK
ncbi:hypothetical protein GC197_13640 [bacterium]|nr:hypothetical protein [bacterium]